MTTQLNPNVQFRGLVGDLSEVIDEAILHALEGRNDETLVLASLAEARGNIVRMNHALAIVHISMEPPTHNDHLPHGAQPKALPKVRPLPSEKPGDTRTWEKLRPGIGKKLKSPRAFDCPTCHAEAGTSCFKFTTQGKHGVVTDQRNSGTTYHTARSALSTAHNDRARREYDKAMAKEHES